MSFDKTLAFRVLFSWDLMLAAIFTGHWGISLSTMAALVRDGKDGPLKLALWQQDFLRWLEPRLSNAHCEAARLDDRARAQLAVSLLP